MGVCKCKIPEKLMKSVCAFEETLGVRAEEALFYWKNEGEGYCAVYYLQEDEIDLRVEISENGTKYLAIGALNNWYTMFAERDLFEHLLCMNNEFKYAAFGIGKGDDHFMEYVFDATYYFPHGENTLDFPELYGKQAVQIFEQFYKEIQQFDNYYNELY